MKFLGNNTLQSGENPACVSSCLNPTTITTLGYSMLMGRIPLELSSLLNLQLLNVEFNNLTGGIPPFYGDFSNLEQHGTVFNNFDGILTDTLSQKCTT